MKFSVISYLLGRLCCIIGIFLAIPALASFYFKETESLQAFLFTSALALILGIGLMFVFRKESKAQISKRDGFLLVTVSWFAASALGAIPYYWTGVFPGFVDAFFESVSGFTTTGASVMTDIEASPKSILLWRSLTQWIGGLGIIVLAVAILPHLSVGGMQLMKNEMPGPTFDKLKPRIRQTALSLWKIYGLFSLILFALLYACGMSGFESLCHMLSTISSGGFSTRNASITAFPVSIQLVITVFMFMAGINFVLHYAWLHGNFKKIFQDNEWKFFTVLLLAACLTILFDLMLRVEYSFMDAARVGVFQVLSIASSTGFVTENYDSWPFLSKGILFLLMFVGGCAGSTSGGFKQIRLQLLLLKARSTLLKQIFPKVVTRVKIGKAAVAEDVLDGVSNLFLVSVVVFSFFTLVLLAFNIGFVTSTTAVVACLSNIGPGMGLVGPVLNYAWMPDVVKVLLAVCMVVGRLEFFTVLVLFLPIAWKR